MSVARTLALAQDYVVSRLTDVATGFNAVIQQTSQTYKVKPFQLSLGGNPPTLYLGRYSISSIFKSGGVGGLTSNFPVAIVSVAKGDSTGQQALRVTPSSFSGQVIVSIDFQVTYTVTNLPDDGNAMFFAVADALCAAMNARSSYNLVPQGLGYNNEILIEQGIMEWDGSRWIQQIACAVIFNVVA